MPGGKTTKRHSFIRTRVPGLHDMQAGSPFTLITILYTSANFEVVDTECCSIWIHETVYGLDGKRPIDMVSKTVDFEIVKDLIGKIKHGIFS